MKESTFETKIDIKNILPEGIDILKGIGYIDRSAPDVILDLVDRLIIESERYANIKGGYYIFDNGSVNVGTGNFELKNIEFSAGKIITKQLTKSTSMAFLAVTIGNEFDHWIKGLFDSGDPLKGYIVDTIGSELAENAADLVEELIVDEVKKKNLGCTNRYSPGYCGWNVSEQHKFFSLLPQKFCDIELSESALMKPIKSVSAAVGIGKDCQKKDYNCTLCSMEDCYKRSKVST